MRGLVRRHRMSNHQAVGRQPAPTVPSRDGSRGGIAAAPTGDTTLPATDPVCGMKVDPTRSKHRFEHRGLTFHFCSTGCRAKFAAAPQSYLEPKAAAPAPAKAGATYTRPMHPEIRQLGPGS